MRLELKSKPNLRLVARYGRLPAKFVKEGVIVNRYKMLIAIVVFGCPVQVHAQRGGNDVDEILQLFDADDDQTITFNEIDQSAQRIRIMDANDDKQVSAAELVAASGVAGTVRSSAALASQLMEFDQDKDGKISPDEVPHRLRLVVQAADQDKDGLMDKAELDAMAVQMAAAAPVARRRRSGRDDDDDENDDEVNPARMVQRALMFDEDNNGQLNSHELRKFVEAIARRGRRGRPRTNRAD